MSELKNISIDSLAFGGSGVGRIDGKVCFVPFSSPGDILKVEIISSKRSFQTAEIREIISGSECRVQPECSLFGVCGGCSWQHIVYSQQIAAKRQILADSLWRSARVSSDLIVDCIPAATPFNYRSRVQFKLAYDEGKLSIGFFRSNSHSVEDVLSGCPIARPEINAVLGALRTILEKCPDKRSIVQIHVDSAENGVAVIIQHSEKNTDGLRSFFLKQSEFLEPLSGLFLQNSSVNSTGCIYGEQYLTYSLPFAGDVNRFCRLSYQVGGFSQVNRQQNQSLLSVATEMIAPSAGMKILDLYCGNGNFSLPLSNLVQSVTGVELHEASTAAAKFNVLTSGIENAEYFCADSVKFVKKLVRQGEHFDAVLLDPPRSGAADLVADVCRLNPGKIVYISCDPSTLGRDCGLFASNGYFVSRSVPVDMFPQTWHLESVTLLERMNKGV